MENEELKNELIKQIQLPENTEDDMVNYEYLGIDFPNSARETYKCPIYFENEGSNTNTSFLMPGENPFEQALKLNDTFYKFRMMFENIDKRIIAAQYNACIGYIITNKMKTEFRINARSVIFSGIINVIRPFVVSDCDFVDMGGYSHPEKQNIYETIMYRLPGEFIGSTSVDNHYNSPITTTSSMFTVIGPDGIPKYVDQNESLTKSFEFIQAYSVLLSKYYHTIISDIIMPNIFVNQFADTYIREIGENPDKYSPGDKQAYTQSILLEQASNDFNKIMELYEFSIMNAFTLFSKLKVPDYSEVNISQLRNAAKQLRIPISNDPEF